MTHTLGPLVPLALCVFPTGLPLHTGRGASGGGHLLMLFTCEPSTRHGAGTEMGALGRYLSDSRKPLCHSEAQPRLPGAGAASVRPFPGLRHPSIRATNDISFSHQERPSNGSEPPQGGRGSECSRNRSKPAWQEHGQLRSRSGGQRGLLREPPCILQLQECGGGGSAEAGLRG